MILKKYSTLKEVKIIILLFIKAKQLKYSSVTHKKKNTLEHKVLAETKLKRTTKIMQKNSC